MGFWGRSWHPLCGFLEAAPDVLEPLGAPSESVILDCSRGLGFRVLGVGFWVLGFGFWGYALGFRV